MSLYEHLTEASQAEKQETAAGLINAMRGSNQQVNLAYWELCKAVINLHGAHETEADQYLPRWEFSAANSALLIRSVPRVSGFLRALDRAPQASRIIDAGCGSSVILAIGAAISHPDAKVFAYDINQPAVECAKTMVDLFGLQDQIEVDTKDVINTELPQADLAVTETFCSGLFTELGHQITASLARVSKEILPAKSKVYATDTATDLTAALNSTNWQLATEIDFATSNVEVQGSLRSTGTGRRHVGVYATYYDARDESIISKLGANNLTNPVCLGTVDAHPGNTISFTYQLGLEPHENDITLRVRP